MAGFESDHRLIQTSFNLTFDQVPRTRLDWMRANVPQVQKNVKKALQSLDRYITLNTIEEIDEYAAKLAKSLDAATISSVPLKKPRTSVSKLGNITHGEAAGIGDMSPPAIRARLAKHHKAVMQVKRREWRRFVAKSSGRHHGIHRIARLGQRICQPAAPPHLKSLIDANGVSHTDSPTMGRTVRDHLWPETSDHVATPIPRPHASPQREQYPCPQELRDGEVEKLINKLKRGKAAGHDKVANEILKMAKDMILPYLERLFGACIALSHEPISFRHARTVIMRKPDKKSYALPKSWRPIALLSSLGKLLEAIIAQRLRELCAKYNILPATQFGVAGKCTTRALRKLLGSVYSAWCRDLYASVMSFDIEGAYNRVGRAKLLEILAEKGIPDWIIEFVWSFLSSRSTTLDMPGHPTRRSYFVNIGIPQGSPLSPILFLFFTAPMLDRLSSTLRNPDKVAFSYVDDNYLLVVSDSHENNCRMLTRLFEEVMAWARESGVIFEPSKYAVMHFQKPRSQRKCLLQPNIEGVAKICMETKMRILGVIVDSRLTWLGHVEHVSSMSW